MARRATLFAPTTLAAAIERLGFVQADPIRAPARAQDLILRHRVRGYRAGDLERRFARLGLEEDFLHAHGFMPTATRHLLHPRAVPGSADPLDAAVLAFVQERGRTHPADLALRFGRDRAPNNWGGFSKATTRALDRLHHQGLLRVAGRANGIRLYAPAPPPPPALDPAERARQLVLRIATILAPVSPASLRAALALLAFRNPGLPPLAPVIAAARSTGELRAEEIDEETYLFPATLDPAPTPRRELRLLAPFDPLVWDRRRFRHLYGWTYKFEAYTPPAQRRLGYYAMPLLWGDAVIGWANVTFTAGKLDASLGYAARVPRSKAYGRALEAELDRMERFLAANTAPHPGEA